LIDLDDITQPSIFTTLKMRFIENKEYTYIGNDMVFINSYNNNMNDMNELENYIDYFKSDNNNNKLPIDVWNLANSVYNELNKTSTNQSIIFCGESGSGKTKCMQKCIELYSQYNFTSSKTSQSTLKYKQKLNSINSILESFGHSKTIHNKSSSCFIKYFEFNYSLDDKLTLQNVKLKPILSSLDLSRISYQNYHFLRLTLNSSPSHHRIFLEGFFGAHHFPKDKILLKVQIICDHQ
jgi:myosin heavy subunit